MGAARLALSRTVLDQLRCLARRRPSHKKTVEHFPELLERKLIEFLVEPDLDSEFPTLLTSINLFAEEVIVRQGVLVSAQGGDADSLITFDTSIEGDSLGGDGGFVELFCPGGLQCITLNGDISIDGGDGADDGDEGIAIVGGQQELP